MQQKKEKENPAADLVQMRLYFSTLMLDGTHNKERCDARKALPKHSIGEPSDLHSYD